MRNFSESLFLYAVKGGDISIVQTEDGSKFFEIDRELHADPISFCQWTNYYEIRDGEKLGGFEYLPRAKDMILDIVPFDHRPK